MGKTSLEKISLFYILTFSFLSFVSMGVGSYYTAMVFNLAIPITILFGFIIIPALKNKNGFGSKIIPDQDNGNHQANP